MTNNTEYEEMLIAGRIRAKEYYDKNKERLRKKARDRYNRIKNGEPPSGKKGGRPKNNIDPICECLSCGEKFKVRLSEYKRGGGKLVKGFKKDRIFQDGIHSSQNRKKKEKEGSE